MHPWHHAQRSAAKFGGEAKDYLEVHSWMDGSKEFIGDLRHRALRHHTEGIYLAERLFGPVITNSNGTQIPTRIVLEYHVKEDLGFIPSVYQWLHSIQVQPWMMRGHDAREMTRELAAAPIPDTTGIPG